MQNSSPLCKERWFHSTELFSLCWTHSSRIGSQKHHILVLHLSSSVNIWLCLHSHDSRAWRCRASGLFAVSWSAVSSAVEQSGKWQRAHISTVLRQGGTMSRLNELPVYSSVKGRWKELPNMPFLQSLFPLSMTVPTLSSTSWVISTPGSPQEG